MKSPAHRPASSRTRFVDGCKRTFGRTFAVPRAGRSLTLSIAIAAVLVTGAAAAAWQVNDRNTQSEIKKVQDRLGNNGTVTGKLNDLNLKMSLDQRSNAQTPDMVAAPKDDEALHPMQPSNFPVLLDEICADGVNAPLSVQQQQLCMELANTELAKYRFSMRMSARAEDHYKRLKEIHDRRRGLGANDYGDVQYNTNELLTLTALMDNDRDRYMTYMHAYDARILHIRNARSALTRNALKGNGPLPMPTGTSSF